MNNLRPSIIFVLACASACVTDEPPAEANSSSSDTSSSGGTPSTGNAEESSADGIDDGSTSAAGGSTSSETDSTSEGSAGCAGDADCDGLQPFCDIDSGVCVDCTSARDGACASLDAGTDVCSDAGRCVECTAADVSPCVGPTPVCNADESTCMECREHSDCPGSACKIRGALAALGEGDWGSCFSPETVRNVHPDGSMEFSAISDAIADIPAGGDGVLILHGDSGFDEGVALLAGQSVAFLRSAGAGDSWTWRQSSETDGPTLYIEGGARAWLHKGRFLVNSADEPAVVAAGASVHVQRSQFRFISQGGLLAEDSANAHIENSFFSGINSGDAVAVSSAEATLLYTTIVSATGLSLPEGLACDSSAVEVRNSIIIGQDDNTGLDCPGLTISHSATTEQQPGEGNVALGFPELEWFARWDHDLHLGNAPPAVFTAALWQTGDPVLDYDGDARPAEDGSVDVAGADLP